MGTLQRECAFSNLQSGGSTEENLSSGFKVSDLLRRSERKLRDL